MVTSKQHAIHQTTWGKNCQAYTLLNTGGMTIKQEIMPPHTEEVLHYHKHAQQYFYLLTGQAVFEVDEAVHIVHAGEGMHIKPGQKHRIMNKMDEDIELLVTSQPSADNDRFNLA